MKLAAAQTRPTPGDIQENLSQHLSLIQLAAKHDVDHIVFPELSLTGYVLQEARILAARLGPGQLDIFQALADELLLSITVGLPTPDEAPPAQLPRISAKTFAPGSKQEVYSKRFLHEDELPYFSPGSTDNLLIRRSPNIALAICYENSQDAQLEEALKQGAKIYVASVAKTAQGVQSAKHRLAEVSKQHSIPTLLVNSIGLQGGEDCAGVSAAWNDSGDLLAELVNSTPGILVLDTSSQTAICAEL